MITGRPDASRISLKIFSAPARPSPRAVLMLEQFDLSKLVLDHVSAKLVRNLPDRSRHLKGVRAAFELAGTCDEGDRKRLSDTHGSARSRNFDDAVRGEVQAICRGELR